MPSAPIPVCRLQMAAQIGWIASANWLADRCLGTVMRMKSFPAPWNFVNLMVDLRSVFGVDRICIL